MRKMQASAKSLRTGMISLFHLADTLAATTVETRAALDECGAVVVPADEPAAQWTGWGQESVPALLKPLQSGPRVELKVDGSEELMLDDLGLDDNTCTLLRERVDALIESNARHAWQSFAHMGAAFGKIYNHHKDRVNSTCDGLKVFFWCHALNDSNVKKLVRSKVLGIFKPSFRRVIASGAQESSVGIFWRL